MCQCPASFVRLFQASADTIALPATYTSPRDPWNHLSQCGAEAQRERHRRSRGARFFLPYSPKCGGDGCSTCDLCEHDRSLQPFLPVWGWGSARTSPEERGPIEVPLRRKAETDRVREGISEGCRSAKPDRVAPGGARAVEPQPRIHSPCPSVRLYVRIVRAIRLICHAGLQERENPHATKN